MKIERNRPFEQLEPPRGGAARLRRRLDRAAARRFEPSWRLAAACAGVAAVIAAVLALRGTVAPEPEPQLAILSSPALDRLLGRPSSPVALAVRRNDEESTTTELPSSDPSIRIYALD